MSTTARFAIGIIFLILSATDPLAAQDGRVPVEGTVIDSSGRVLIGADVFLRDLDSGLDVLLTEDLAGRLSSQMTAALEAVGNIEPPLRRAVIETPDVVAAARDAVKAVQISVATEVIAQLGVALGFSDADGDSSG